MNAGSENSFIAYNNYKIKKHLIVSGSPKAVMLLNIIDWVNNDYQRNTIHTSTIYVSSSYHCYIHSLTAAVYYRYTLP